MPLFETPILLRYEIPKRRFSYFIEFGLAPSLSMTTSANYSPKIDANKWDEADFLNNPKMQWASFSTIGVNYILNENFQTFLQPSFRYHLTTLNDTRIKENLYSLSLDFGMRYEI